MQIFVDADACPVVAIIEKIAKDIRNQAKTEITVALSYF